MPEWKNETRRGKPTKTWDLNVDGLDIGVHPHADDREAYFVTSKALNIYAKRLGRISVEEAKKKAISTVKDILECRIDDAQTCLGILSEVE